MDEIITWKIDGEFYNGGIRLLLLELEFVVQLCVSYYQRDVT